MDSLRIVTINTGKCDGPYMQRIAWLGQELERLDPDIVACQEVFRNDSGSLDTATRLSRKLDMHLAWSPARFKQRSCEGLSVLGWSGMAILTRVRWRELETIRLPTDERDGDRVAQICVIPWRGRQVVIANVHLTYLKDADGLRWEQLSTVLGHPSFHLPDSLRLVCGDFNTTAGDPVLTNLLAPGEGIDVRDTSPLGGGNTSRSTLPPREDGTARQICIDYILSVADGEAEQPLFRSSGVVLDRPDPETGVLPSDHYGVATTLLPLARPRGLVRNGRRGA